MVPAVLAVRASGSSCFLEVSRLLEEMRRPVSTVDVKLSNPDGRSRQRRKWLVGSRDIRELAAEVAAYIEENAKLWGWADATVVALDGHPESIARSGQPFLGSP